MSEVKIQTVAIADLLGLSSHAQIKDSVNTKSNGNGELR